MDTREALRRRLAYEAGERIARWADARTCAGDFEGRDRTLEIFGVPVAEKRLLHRQLWKLAREIEDASGISMTFVLHTPEAVAAHYQWVLEELAPPLIDSARPGTARTALVRSPGSLGTSAAVRQRKVAG